jgi:hypothetical protein
MEVKAGPFHIEWYIESVQPLLTAGKYTLNVRNVAYAERRDDGSLRVYFVGRDDFLVIEPPESEQMAMLLRDLSGAQEPTPALPGTGKLQDIGSRVEELQRNIEEMARKITPPAAV